MMTVQDRVVEAHTRNKRVLCQVPFFTDWRLNSCSNRPTAANTRTQNRSWASSTAAATMPLTGREERNTERGTTTCVAGAVQHKHYFYGPKASFSACCSNTHSSQQKLNPANLLKFIAVWLMQNAYRYFIFSSVSSHCTSGVILVTLWSLWFWVHEKYWEWFGCNRLS